MATSGLYSLSGNVARCGWVAHIRSSACHVTCGNQTLVIGLGQVFDVLVAAGRRVLLEEKSKSRALAKDCFALCCR